MSTIPSQTPLVIPAGVALETCKDEHKPQSAQLFRQFGVEETLTLYPSIEEFADPAKYLREHAELGEKYGILKVVPPTSWCPKFSLDYESFTFECKKQEVSSLSVSNRTAKDYAERLCQFHAMGGHSVPLTPMLGLWSIPYYNLNHAVHTLGGIGAVDPQDLWPKVASLLGLDINMGMLVRQVYLRDIFPFENYCREIKARADFLFEQSESEPDSDAGDGSDTSENEESDTESTLGEVTDKTQAYRLGFADENIPEPDPDANCIICKNKKTDIGCCRCQEYAHGTCVSRLSPGLNGLPRWYCPKCLVEPAKLYFNIGKTYTLSEFEKRATSFKKNVLQNLRARNMSLPEQEALLEQEFWKIADGTRSKFVVEYGAEIRCEEEGSGFPTKDAYKNDPWNLNNLPYIKDSLFRYVDERISGVTVPWAYVGMTFSAFCWHTEDNFSYSVNYQHLGDPKTWYGIPASHAARFEKLSEWIAPDAFKDTPDLLNERSSLVSPMVLKSHGIPVYGARQVPGEFVVTYPNAYHAGFNQGFNFNEAVNFIPADWIPYGFLALDVYRLRKHEPTFCLECVLLRTLRNEENTDVLSAVLPHFITMVKCEIGRRTRYRKLAGRHCNERVVTQRAVDTAVQSSTYKCPHCKSIPYLSRVHTKSGRYCCVNCATGWGSGRREVTHGIFETLYSDKALNAFITDAKKRLNCND